MSKSVLITGASGFVGRNCLGPLVRRGYEVHAVAASREGDPEPGVTWHRVDLHNRAEVRRLLDATRAETLLHLAWNAQPGQAYTSPENYDWVVSSLDLVQRFVELGGRRVVAAGTCYEYDQDYGWCHEQRTPLEPATLYGVCKNVLRQLLATYCHTEGVSFAWPRVFFLYGPHENPKRLASSVVLSLLRGQRAECSHGRQLRDFMYVEDLADALVELSASEVQGAVNLGCGTPVPLADLVERIGDRMGRPDLIALGALAARPDEAPLIAADTTRQREELGWAPSHSLDDAIDKTIAWWRTQTPDTEEAPCPKSQS